MDLLATVITAATIATGNIDAHRVPDVPKNAGIMNQLRYGAAKLNRYQYLTSEQGKDYWREQYVEIPKMHLPPEFRGLVETQPKGQGQQAPDRQYAPNQNRY